MGAGSSGEIFWGSWGEISKQLKQCSMWPISFPFFLSPFSYLCFQHLGATCLFPLNPSSFFSYAEEHGMWCHMLYLGPRLYDPSCPLLLTPLGAGDGAGAGWLVPIWWRCSLKGADAVCCFSQVIIAGSLFQPHPSSICRTSGNTRGKANCQFWGLEQIFPTWQNDKLLWGFFTCNPPPKRTGFGELNYKYNHFSGFQGSWWVRKGLTIVQD